MTITLSLLMGTTVAANPLAGTFTLTAGTSNIVEGVSFTSPFNQLPEVAEQDGGVPAMTAGASLVESIVVSEEDMDIQDDSDEKVDDNCFNAKYKWFLKCNS